MPAVGTTLSMQTNPGGNSLAALGAAPMPVAMFGSPIPWSNLLDPNAPQMSMMRAPTVGSFVLDPSLADQSSPDGLDVHVLVESALPGAEQVHYVVLERPVIALGCSGDAVFTAAPNRDTGAAGAVILLQTDSGTVMIDAGMQTPDTRLAAAVGDELGREVAVYLGTADLGEDPVAIDSRNLTEINEDAILDTARKKKPQ